MSGPLHGRRSRPCVRYLHNSACIDVVSRLLPSYSCRFVGFAPRALEHCDGPPGHHRVKRAHDVKDSTVFSSFSHAFSCNRDLLLDLSRLLGLALRPSRSCLLVPPGNLCHTGGWHLRRKPRVEVFFVPFFFVVFVSLSFLMFADWCHTELN